MAKTLPSPTWTFRVLLGRWSNPLVLSTGTKVTRSLILGSTSKTFAKAKCPKCGTILVGDGDVLGNIKAIPLLTSKFNDRITLLFSITSKLFVRRALTSFLATRLPTTEMPPLHRGLILAITTFVIRLPEASTFRSRTKGVMVVILGLLPT